MRGDDATRCALERLATDAAAHPPLGEGEEAGLRARLRDGDAGARERLALAHLRLALRVARRIARRSRLVHLSDDLAAEAVAEVWRVALAFDPDDARPFEAVASLRVGSAVNYCAARLSGPLPVPVVQIRRQGEITRATWALMQRLGRCPSVEEIAAFLGCKVAQVRYTLERGSLAVPLHDPETGEDRPLASPTPDPEARALEAERATVRRRAAARVPRAVATLPPQERGAVVAYFGLDGKAPAEVSEIAERIGTGRTTAWRRVQAGVRRLREGLA